jgi:phage terminase small subunit
MKPLLPRKRTFCDGIAAGLSGAEAARRAGYSARRAKQTASRLLRCPDVLQGIERRRNGYNPHPKFADPLQFLMWFANDPEAGAPRLRVRAAIAALPYLHRRPT